LSGNEQLEKIAHETTTETQKVDEISQKTHVLIVKVVNYQKNKATKNATVKVFRLEKEPLTLKQWAENLKNGSPFKRLIVSMNTDNNGTVTVELAEGSYEVEEEKFGFNKVFDLTQNDEILFIEPKKHWWN
jgi:hypothetical protein